MTNDFENPDLEETQTFPVAGLPDDVGTRRARRQQAQHERKMKHRGLNTALNIIGEVLITFALLCGFYIVWQLWWTGVEAEKTQINDKTVASWSAPASQADSVKIAPDNAADSAPVEDAKWSYGDTVGKIYIPRFGANWSRTIVEGTDNEQLGRHGLGHYTDTQKPGQLGNFAVAGHRDGYGQPLGDADKITKGDLIIVRTENYWYVYEYQRTQIVTPERYDVVAPVPEKPGQKATERYITLTTCDPKYSTPTHRLIVHGTLKSWSRVSDGIPSVLATKAANGKVQFTQDSTRSLESHIPPLNTLVWALLAAYIVIFAAAAFAWRWPAMRAYRELPASKRLFSFYGWFMRAQPGIKGVRIVLALVLALAVIAALFQWGYPWAAAHIPYLQVTSNYVSVG